MKRVDFFLIGAQKTGTTTLGHWLSQHPDVSMSRLNENVYFVEDHLYREGEAFLQRCYAGAEHKRLWGLAYVHMIHSHIAIDRVERHNPDAKIIAVLRNPIDRAYSAYWFARRSGWERCETFEDAIALEAERRHGSPTERRELAYLKNGEYADQLRPWIERFGRERVHVVLTDDIKRDSEAVLADTLAFLGLEAAPGIDTKTRLNESALPRIPLLQHAIHSHDGLHKRLGRTVMPAAVRLTMWDRVLYPLQRWNLKPTKYAPMTAETRERLAADYAPKNAALGELIGRDLSGWK